MTTEATINKTTATTKVVNEDITLTLGDQTLTLNVSNVTAVTDALLAARKLAYGAKRENNAAAKIARATERKAKEAARIATLEKKLKDAKAAAAKKAKAASK